MNSETGKADIAIIGFSRGYIVHDQTNMTFDQGDQRYQDHIHKLK